MKKSLFITTVIMVVVLIVALSTATYAWFTVSGTVTTSEVQFTAVTTDNLEISLSPDTGYTQSVAMVWNQPESGIWPLSLKSIPYAAATTDAEWVFGAGTEGVDAWAFTEANDNGTETPITMAGNYLIEELYLRSSGEVSVSLSGDSVIKPNEIGVNLNGTIDRDLLVGAVRVAIFDQNNTLIKVWAPNANIKLTEPANIVVGNDGTDTNNTADASYSDKFLSHTGSTLTPEIPLIDLASGIYQKITVLVWIEGTDPEAHNILTGGKFVVGLSFLGA